MTREEVQAHGLNYSLTHVDFMVGTADLSIVGTTHDGVRSPSLSNGKHLPSDAADLTRKRELYDHKTEI